MNLLETIFLLFLFFGIWLIEKCATVREKLFGIKEINLEICYLQQRRTGFRFLQVFLLII